MKTQSGWWHKLAAGLFILAGGSTLFLPAFPASAAGPVAVWAQRYNGPTSTSAGYATAIAVDTSNNVVVTGFTDNRFTTIEYSSAGFPLWTNFYSWPVPYEDHPTALATDGSNNVIVTGFSENLRVGVFAAVTIQYSSSGVPLWTNIYFGYGNTSAYPTALAVDASNNIIVTVMSMGSSGDYATVKYSSAGVPLWTNRYNGPGNGDDRPFAVAIDRDNNVVVTGESTGSGSGYDYATIKYSSDGIPLWTNRYNGPANGNDAAFAVALDSSNNVTITGASGNGIGSDSATIHYSSDGTALWTNRFSAPQGSYVQSGTTVAVDASDNVIVLDDKATFGGPQAIIKYSNLGIPLWTNGFIGPGASSGQIGDTSQALAADSSGNVIVGASSYSASTGYDYATAEYSSAGIPLWTNFYNGPANKDDKAVALAIDHAGSIIVTGTSSDGTYLGYVTVKYVFPPLLAAVPLPDGSFQLQVNDPAQAPALLLEASVDLLSWTPVYTNTTPTNLLLYTDPDSTNHPWRFYRASQRW